MHTHPYTIYNLKSTVRNNTINMRFLIRYKTNNNDDDDNDDDTDDYDDADDDDDDDDPQSTLHWSRSH